MTICLDIPPITEKTSPMMLQWHTCKKKAEDAVLFFRLGDFYEAFYADAEILAKELDITLTRRQETPMAGIPFHTSEAYIDKLVAKGYRVAIAEQMEDPKETKGIVKREIVRIVTPGTVILSSLLSEKNNNYLASLSLVNQTLGLTILDLTTGECKTFEFTNFSLLFDELVRIKPKEIILSKKVLASHLATFEELKSDIGFSLLTREESHFEPKYTYEFLTHHFGMQSLDGFGLMGSTASISSAGALLSYIKEDLNLPIDHIQSIKKESLGEYMSLDSTTLRHLEILENMQDKESKYTLLHHLDKTFTPMGGRLLKYWLSNPLLSLPKILERQEAISFLLEFPHFNALASPLSKIKDLERLIMRIETGFAGPKDLLALRISLEESPNLFSLLSHTNCPLIQKQVEKLCDVSVITEKLKIALQDDPPLRLSDGNVIRQGYSEELDELRAVCQNSHDWIAAYQTQLREETSLKTLKVGYTKAFGYYIEVSRLQAEKMPASFQRRQTLVNTERFITEELKEYEHKVLSAEEKIAGIEASIFQDLRKEVTAYAAKIRGMATATAHIDCLRSLAKVALDYSYVKPIVDEGSTFDVEDGRHPIIEASLRSDTFIPNDTHLDANENRLFIITGPNMAGKSTFIRQVALLAILAQIGSFVPAKKAHIGLIDKVFTRIGASDNLSRGQSTFMVEMAETANILHNATSKSLVILDEIGRGTSTYDGISIAWAVAEYLLTTEGKQAKTLFATHYSELIELEGKIPGAVNYNISVHESEKGIVFLRKIVRGGSHRSYGIHVAKLAGLPPIVLKKAHEILKGLEKSPTTKKVIPKEEQLSFFELPQESPLLKEIRDIDINTLTPLEALQRLAEWKKRA
jgi:DNA mismatch repair protein MutS